jgi:hypothetical protein
MERNANLLRHMVTHCVPLTRAAEGFDFARNKIATKVMVLPDQEFAQVVGA